MHAANIGAQRHIEALTDGLQDKYAARRKKDADPWGLHIEGAAGELAFARAVDRYWSGPVGNFKDADLGTRVQVRTRGHHSHDLIVREADNPAHAYALVTGRAPNFQVHGWIWGRDAKQECWRANHGGHGWAFFVPQQALTQIHARAHARAA